MIPSRLESIRSQIIAFAMLAALIPSLAIALIAYQQNRIALTEKITRELSTGATQFSRESDVWLKERLYDLRVFAGSSVVSETLARGGGAGRLTEYLESVRARFADYAEIQVVDSKGNLVASNVERRKARPQTVQWRKAFDGARNYVGEPFLDEKVKKVVVLLGVPIIRGDGRMLGALVAFVNFGALSDGLRIDGKEHLYLVSASGSLIMELNGQEETKVESGIPEEVMVRVRSAEGAVVGIQNANGVAVLASGHPLTQADWLAVADRPIADAYRLSLRLRDQAILVISVLLAVIAVVAYWLASLIASPLVRLSGAAEKVSAGDLTVGLPEVGRGEVGTLTRAFNLMIESLRKSREELERISTTDVLTGLRNRRHLMIQLSQEVERSSRSGQVFSVLMLDVDHFKHYNDTHGHQAGDDVLARVGAVLNSAVRKYDCAARYGGEEFLLVLSGTSLDSARESAERIRGQISEEQIKGGPVTVSIGIAEFPRHGESVESIISRADAALYEAKRDGRNRVESA